MIMAGAEVTGYALEAPTDPGLFDMCNLAGQMNSVTGDVRDLAHLKNVFEETQPEIVIHMAAQPLVRESYKNPVYTYETNVMYGQYSGVRADDSVCKIVSQCDN